MRQLLFLSFVPRDNETEAAVNTLLCQKKTHTTSICLLNMCSDITIGTAPNCG